MVDRRDDEEPVYLKEDLVAWQSCILWILPNKSLHVPTQPCADIGLTCGQMSSVEAGVITIDPRAIWWEIMQKHPFYSRDVPIPGIPVHFPFPICHPPTTTRWIGYSNWAGLKTISGVIFSPKLFWVRFLRSCYQSWRNIYEPAPRVLYYEFHTG